MGAELLTLVGAKSLALASTLPNTKPAGAAGALAAVLSAPVVALLRKELNSFLAGAVLDASRLNLKPPVDEEPKVSDGLASDLGSFGKLGFGSSQQGHFLSVDLLLAKQPGQLQLSFGGRN